MQLTLSRQTGRRLPVLRRLHPRPEPRHARRRILVDRPVRPEPHLRRARRGSHARPERLVERVPARTAPRARWTTRSAAGCSTAGSCRASRRSQAAFRCRLSFSGDAASAPIAAGYFGTADVVGPSNSGGNALAPVYTCDPRLDGTKRRREDPRRQLHRGTRVRRERRPRPAVQHPHADADEPRPHRLQELQDRRRAEAAVPASASSTSSTRRSRTRTSAATST